MGFLDKIKKGLNRTVQALLGDEVLFSLPVSRYVEGQP